MPNNFNPSQWTFYNPGGGGIEGGLFGNRGNPLNPFTGQPGTKDNPISIAWGPNSPRQFGQLEWIGGPFGWGRWEDSGPGVKHGDIAVGGLFKKMARLGYLPQLFQSGRNLVQSGRNILKAPGGLVKGGPFGGWTNRDVDMWRNSPGYNQVQDPSTGNPYFGTNPGNTQGGPTMLNTNWVSTPWGNVPMALLNNPQASLNPLDYVLNRSQGPQGAGTGVPTQKAVGAGVGAITNLFVPGLGFLTGPLARMLVRQMQKGGGQPGQPRPPATPQTPAPSPFGGGGGFKMPQGMGFWGQNPGDNPMFVKWAQPSGFGPHTANPSQPGWIGGTPFGASSISNPGARAGAMGPTGSPLWATAILPNFAAPSGPTNLYSRFGPTGQGPYGMFNEVIKKGGWGAGGGPRMNPRQT